VFTHRSNRKCPARVKLPFCVNNSFHSEPKLLSSRTLGCQFARDDVVVQEIEIPATGWDAFNLCAERRGVDARSWLTVILADGLSRDISLEEMVR
jgi:hypothetical protein